MGIIQEEHIDSVRVLKLKRDVINAINLQLVTALTDTLKNMARETKVRGCVLTSSNEKFFSIGFDIPELVDLSRKDFGAFFHSFNQLCIDLYTFPKPVIAAINGHATAGGCILALCCDYRFIAAGRKLMGLNEIKLGVPIPYPADYILDQLVGYQNARNMVDTGEFFLPDKLLQMGIVDEVLPMEQLLVKAIEKARLMGSYPQKAYAMIKHNRVESVKARILSKLKENDEFFLECWFSKEAQQRLNEAIEKFQSK